MSHTQERKDNGVDKKWADSLTRKWNRLKSIMEYDLFHTKALLNGDHQLCALIDPGFNAFATISQNSVNRFQLLTKPLQPKIITGVLNKIMGVINQLAIFTLDIEGLKTNSVHANVVQNKTEDMIFGMLWRRRVENGF